jgi:hypothetical protein
LGWLAIIEGSIKHLQDHKANYWVVKERKQECPV